MVKKIYIKTLSFILLTVCILSIQTTVFATDTNKYVKIGLTRELSSKPQITINNTSINVGYNYESFVTLPLNLTSNTNFVAKPVSGYFVKLSETVATNDDLVLLQSNYGLQGIVNTIIYVTNNNEYSLLVGPFGTMAEAQIKVTEIATLGNAATIQPVTNKVSLIIDNNIALIFGNETLKPQVTSYVPNTNMNISNNLNYRGAIQFNIVDGFVQTVNVVPLEQYLYGLVPSEMPASWHTEALKAQAVAARTYAYSTSKHAADGFDLCDTTHCQVYKGVNNEYATSNAAVDSTAGIVAYNNNNLIEALFYSSNGGSTANSEDVWANVISYLRAKADPYENNDSKWTRQFTQTELTNLVLAKQSNLGTVQSVVIDQKDAFGRATSLTFVCTNGTYSVKKDAIRTFFSSTTNGSLRSTNFKITSNISTSNASVINDIDNLAIYSNDAIFDYKGGMTIVTSGGISTTNDNTTSVIDSTDTITSYGRSEIIASGDLVLTGTGYGHGVGMSQYGAKGMAEQGFTYDKILSFYYTGVTLK